MSEKRIKEMAEKEAKAIEMAASLAKVKAEKAAASAKAKAERDAKAAEKATAKAAKRVQQKAERAENAAAKAKKKADKKGGKVLAKKKLGEKKKTSTIAVKDDTSGKGKTKAKKDTPTPSTSSSKPSKATIDQVKGILPTLLEQKDEPELVAVTTASSVQSMSTTGSSTTIDDVKGILPTLLQRAKQRLTPEVVTVASTTVSAALATKKSKNPLEEMGADEGLFAPAVLLTKDVFGTPKLNALRAKVIKEHTAVIGKLTDTADSAFGDTVLKLLFELADKDGNGTIDEYELGRALNALGCGFIPEKQINGMFKRADKDGSCGLDYEEWCKAAPKTLKSALVKLAKKNGHELGFLA